LHVFGALKRGNGYNRPQLLLQVPEPCNKKAFKDCQAKMAYYANEKCAPTKALRDKDYKVRDLLLCSFAETQVYAA
jgi:hypothetical protein